MELEHTDNYKYLGFIQSTKNNMKNQVQTLKGNIEAVYWMILALAGNTTFKNIEMKSTLEHILTYNGDIWDLSKGQAKDLDGIMDKKDSQTKSHQEHQANHSGLLDPETIMRQNRGIMDVRIQNTVSDSSQPTPKDSDTF